MKKLNGSNQGKLHRAGIEIAAVRTLSPPKTPKILLQCAADFSQLRPCFDDPNGEKLDPSVVNLLSKNQPDPTVNE